MALAAVEDTDICPRCGEDLDVLEDNTRRERPPVRCQREDCDWKEKP